MRYATEVNQHKMPVTIKMIAAAAGVTHPTVSRALQRKSRHVHPETRKKIQKIARAMGYRPNPAMSALIAHRMHIRPNSNYSKIVILNAWNPKALPPYFREEIKGINKTSNELGYEAEIFNLPKDPTEQMQLSRMLYARGIQGIIVGPLPSSYPRIELEWQHFFAVTIGYSMIAPHLHFVASNHLSTIENIYTNLQEKGYKKIGYLHYTDSEKRNHHLYLASYLKMQMLSGIYSNRMPPLLIEDNSPEKLQKWLSQHDYDAIICGGGYEFTLLKKTLDKLGMKVPHDIGVAVFALGPEASKNTSGVMEDWRGLGNGAVDLLHSLMLTGERGIPTQRKSILIDATWQPGRSIHAQ